MSKKNKKNITQKQMLSGIINNPLLIEDRNACKTLLVAYKNENTEGLTMEEKYEFAQEFIFPLNKKIDLYNELDKLNDPLLNAAYFRLRNKFIDIEKLKVDDYFKLVALVEILLIGYQHHKEFDDDTLEVLATVLAYNTNITYDLIKKEIGNSKKKN